MTHREAMDAPIPRESLHRITDWEREQADTPPYTVDEMNVYVRWSIVVLCILALAVALSPVFWSYV